MKQEGKFEYLETGGSGEPLLLLHGLFGGLSNFEDQIHFFRDRYNVILPTLPIMTHPTKSIIYNLEVAASINIRYRSARHRMAWSLPAQRL